MNGILNINFYRSVSRVFSIPAFKVVLDTGNSDYILNKFKKYRNEFNIKSNLTVKNILNYSYKRLKEFYRNEYVYKNIITNELLLRGDDVYRSVLINEFKIADSISDLVFINGKSELYEIKTELDSYEKLNKQLMDYYKVFPNVNIVTHYSLVDKYLKITNFNDVGLVALNKDYSLTVIKKSTQYTEHLNNVNMIKCLRKNEYSNIIENYFGYLPNVTPINFFKACINLIQRIEPTKLQNLMITELKKRVIREKKMLTSKNIPSAIKFLCLCLNPSTNGYKNLNTFLNKNLS